MKILFYFCNILINDFEINFNWISRPDSANEVLWVIIFFCQKKNKMKMTRLSHQGKCKRSEMMTRLTLNSIGSWITKWTFTASHSVAERGIGMLRDFTTSFCEEWFIPGKNSATFTTATRELFTAPVTVLSRRRCLTLEFPSPINKTRLQKAPKSFLLRI